MFNFNEFENITNKRNAKNDQGSDVKIYANNRIRFSENAIEKLDAKDKKILILQNPKNKAVVITASVTQGRSLSGADKNQFTNEVVAETLNGTFSEWEIVGDGVQNPATNEIWYELQQTVNGEEERQKLSDLANENEVEVAEEESVSEEEEMEQD